MSTGGVSVFSVGEVSRRGPVWSYIATGTGVTSSFGFWYHLDHDVVQLKWMR